MEPNSDAPDRPEIGEVLPSYMAGVMQPYIGQLDPDPRRPPRYAVVHTNRQWLQRYRQTMRDEQVSACIEQRLLAVVSRPWDVEAVSEERADKDVADMVRRQLYGTHTDLERVSRQMLLALWNGYAVGECLWAIDGASVKLQDLLVRAPDRFIWRANEMLMCTRAHPEGERMGRAKYWLLTRPGEHADEPHGIGLGYWCYWLSLFKRAGLKMWGQALERFATPVPKGTYPQGASPAERARLLELVQTVSRGAGVTIREDANLEYLESRARTTGASYQDFQLYLDALIAKVLLGQSSTTEQGPWRGTAEVQLQVRDELVGSDARLLAGGIRKTVFSWLCAWNAPGAIAPLLRSDDSDAQEARWAQRAEREERIARTTGLRPTQAYIERTYGGEWEPSPRPPALFARGRTPGAGPGIAKAVENLLDNDGWEPLMGGTVQPLLDAARDADRKGETLAEFRARLPTLVRDLDARALTEALANLGFSAAAEGALDDANK